MGAFFLVEGEGMTDPFLEGVPVEQPRQGVMAGLMLDLLDQMA